MSNCVRAMRKEDTVTVAMLHEQGIHTGFLSSLGRRFLRQMYRAVPSCPAGFGFVWQEAPGNVQGFVACAESTGRLYKQALLRRGVLMAASIARFLLRPTVLKRLVETLRYPAQVGPDLPPAELLSIVVSPDARRKGVGKALVDAMVSEFACRGIPRVKVAVGADNEEANAFYQRQGFKLALTREHHGLPMNVYVLEIGV